MDLAREHWGLRSSSIGRGNHLISFSCMFVFLTTAAPFNSHLPLRQKSVAQAVLSFSLSLLFDYNSQQTTRVQET